MTPTLPEVLKLVSNAKSTRDRVNILKKHESFGLRTILQGAYHPDIKMNLPPGPPPYTPDPAPLGHSPSNLAKELRKIPYFVEGNEMIKQKGKREEIFIQLLESVHPSEADLLIKMKDKDLSSVNGLTYNLVNDTFPDLALPKK